MFHSHFCNLLKIDVLSLLSGSDFNKFFQKINTFFRDFYVVLVPKIKKVVDSFQRLNAVKQEEICERIPKEYVTR